MIIFGLRSGNAFQQQLSARDCDYCHTEHSVRFYFWVRYFHVFWIPIFPLYRSGRSQCSHCKQVLEQSQMSQEMVVDYRVARKTAKTPLKYFSGLIIAAVFFILAVLAVVTDKDNTDTWLQQPQTGDVYEVKRDGAYTLYRIQKVRKDTVLMNPYEFSTDKSSALRKLKKTYPNAYEEEVMPFAKTELATMYAEREIRRIERK